MQPTFTLAIVYQLSLITSYYPTSCRPRAISTSCHPQAKLSPTTVPTTVTYPQVVAHKLSPAKKKTHQACNNRGLKLQ
ncbi:18861_t:CDS:1, partial [Gigaspora margarita]